MAKAPKVGQVKSRLALEIGWFASCAFYRETLKKTIFKLSDNRWKTFLAITPDAAAKSKRFWYNQKNIICQGKGTLGKRMVKIMANTPLGPTIIIGTDIPGIRKHHIEIAFKALRNLDVVFGPSKDGGYWLVGLKRRPKLIKLFPNVRWSSIHTLSDTALNVPAKAKIAILETLVDVDDLKDLRDSRKFS